MAITYPLTNPMYTSYVAQTLKITSAYQFSRIFDSANRSFFPYNVPPSDPTGIQYHNLTMGPGYSGRAAAAIYAPYSAGANMALDNWLNYDIAPNIVLDIDIQNKTNVGPQICDLQIDLWMGDSQGALTNVFGSTQVVGAGGALSFTNYATPFTVGTDTGGAALAYWGYIIVLEVYGVNAVNPGFGIAPTIFNAFDTDGVGPDQGRDVNPYPPFPNNSGNGRQLVVFNTGNGNPADPTYGGEPIAINKRTTLQFYFQ
jgi:hypothetical protein